MKKIVGNLLVLAALVVLFQQRHRIAEAFREGFGSSEIVLEVTGFKCDGVTFSGNVKNVSQKPVSASAKVLVKEADGKNQIIAEPPTGKPLQPGASRRFEIKTPPFYKGGECRLLPFVDDATGYGLEYRSPAS